MRGQTSTTSVAIVHQSGDKYRQIAQRNWGLNPEQMIGMHVHHRIPVSQGGTNDPSNLYVCSPWFHAHVWHGDESYYPLVRWCAEAGRKGGSVKNGPMSDEMKLKVSKGKTGKKPKWEGKYPNMKRKKATCPECGKVCANAGSLACHIKVHFR